MDKLPANTREFLERFYLLLDGESPQDTKNWSEMFEQNGQFIAAGQTQKGRRDIYSHREDFWEMFPGIRHEPKRVYISPGSWLAIIVITKFTLRKKNIAPISSYTVAEFRLSETEGGIQIQTLELFMDPATPIFNLENYA